MVFIANLFTQATTDVMPVHNTTWTHFLQLADKQDVHNILHENYAAKAALDLKSFVTRTKGIKSLAYSTPLVELVGINNFLILTNRIIMDR